MIPIGRPVRCSEPSGYAHVGAEVAFAALTGLASGRPQRVDVSMQEVVLIASMATPARFPQTGFRGVRRGANIGRTREIWPTRDGFVSFGLRGGKARVPSLETLTRLVDTPALQSMDWSTFSPNTTDDETLRAIEVDVAAFFARHTMSELYDYACETNLMLAPINSPREILASAQLAAREFFGPLGDVEQFPLSFATVRSADGLVARVRSLLPRPELGQGTVPARPARPAVAPAPPAGTGAWAGTNLLELGSGAAGPIATRYFAEHGATVLRIESRSRPDFLRVYALGPDNPHGLEGAPMFDGLNVGKRDVTFNLKHPRAVELVRRLIFEWADAVAENFAPRAMRGFGLDYDSLAVDKPDLVMLSACLNGQTGPHRNYPGFGGQGSALAGYNFLTGWPDREPVGPHGTITDSLAPRFAATALAAGAALPPPHRPRRVRRRLPGRGGDLLAVPLAARVPDAPARSAAGRATHRTGRSCTTRSRASTRTASATAGSRSRRGPTKRRRRSRRSPAPRRSGRSGSRSGPVSMRPRRCRPTGSRRCRCRTSATSTPIRSSRSASTSSRCTHPFLGDGFYERNGFRLSDAPSGYDRAGPTLGQDQTWVLTELLGLRADDIAALTEDHVFD